MRKEKITIEKYSIKELTAEELLMINGGGLSEGARAVVKFLGMCFINPGQMAADGAAPHEICGK